MKRVKHIVLLLALLSCFDGLTGQDALFSQLHNSRNLLNPSLLALQNNPLQVDLNYREQGNSITSGLPIRTFQVMANYKIKSFEVDQMSFGVSVLNDRGGTGHIGSNLAHLHFAYLKNITGSYSKIGAHYIGIGASLGGGQKSVASDRFWFGNQFNEEYNFIEETKDPREDVLLAINNGQSKIFSDVNFGLTWYANFNEGLSANAGFSIFHLDRANISMIEGGLDRQLLRYNGHGSIRMTVSDIIYLVPRFNFSHMGPSNLLLFGSEVGLDNGDADEFILRLGIFGRAVSSIQGLVFESLVLSMNARYRQFTFGMGYDLTISSLSKYNNGRGAWEFKLGYAIDRSEKTGYRRPKAVFRL